MLVCEASVRSEEIYRREEEKEEEEEGMNINGDE